MDLIITKEFQWCETYTENRSLPDIDMVISELRSIKNKHGEVTPENVLNEARVESSILHSFFEWNDTEAARRYRLSQASKMLRAIEVKIIKDDEPLYIRAYEVLQRGGEFKNRKSVEYKSVSSIEDFSPLKKFLIGDLKRVVKKLSLYDNCEKIIEHLTEAVLLIEKLESSTQNEYKKTA